MVNQFIRDARIEFEKTQAVHNHATTFLVEANKMAVEMLGHAEQLRLAVDQLKQDADRIQSEMAAVQEQTLKISSEINRDLSELRTVVVDSIAGRADAGNVQRLDNINTGAGRREQQIQQLQEGLRVVPLRQ